MRQQPRPLQRAPSAPAVDPSTLDTLPMFHDFLEGSSPTKPDEGVETGEKSHGLADLPHGEVNSDFPADLQHGKVNYDDYQLPADLPHGEVNDQLLAEAGVHGDAMEPKTPEQPESDLPDQPCPRTLDQPLASDAKSLHDEPEPLAPQNVVTENAEGEHGGAVAPEDTKEGGEEPEPADGPEDLFNAEVQTTRHEQFAERDRLAKEAPMTKKQAKAAAAKKKKADDKEKAKLAKENSKALAKAKAKFQKERAKAEKLAAKLAAKADKKDEKKADKKAKAAPKKKAAPKQEATKGRKNKSKDSKETHDEGTTETAEIQGEAPSVPADTGGPEVKEPKKPRTKKAKQAHTPGDGLPVAPEASCPAPVEASGDLDPPKKRKAEDLPDGANDPKENHKEKATFARRIRGKGEKAGKRWDNIKGVFMDLVAPLIRRPSPFEAYVCQKG